MSSHVADRATATEGDRAQAEGRASPAWGTGLVRWSYEAGMIGFALAAVVLLTQPNQGWVRIANVSIWAVFVIDYVVRLALADDRRRFVRENIPDLVAALPLEFVRIARVARVARLVRLIRAGRIMWRATTHVRGVLRTNGLQWVLAVALVTIAAGGATTWAIDPQITTLGDGLWWALVTSTTVGYGDLSPVHPVARGVAAVIMIVGVGTIGMLTGSIATYFARTQPTGRAGPQIEFIQTRLNDWDELTVRDRRELALMLASIATGETAAEPPR